MVIWGSLVPNREGRIRKVDPVFSLPEDIVQKPEMGLMAQVISDSRGEVEDRLNTHSILDNTKKSVYIV